MRRSICTTEPAVALAGEIGTWKFIYSPATHLPKGTRLRFQMGSKGRPIDWQIPETLLKEKSNLIWLELPNGKSLAAKPTADATPDFDFILPSEVAAGETFTIFLGSPSASASKGNRAQMAIQRRRSFHLLIDPKGKEDFKEPELFNVDIKGNVLSQIKIFSPSLVAKNKRFDVMVRFEDKYGNLTSNAPEGTLVELSYEHLRENLSWKLFVPETGFISLPNLYFNETGVYRIQLKNLSTKQTYFSAPIQCQSEIDRSLFWGLLHGESAKFDSTDSIESCLRYFRDEQVFNFYGVSPFEAAEETSNDAWKLVSNHVAEFNEDQRFATFLGFQAFEDNPLEGLRQVVYLKDNKPLPRRKDTKTSYFKKTYKSVPQKELIAIPSFTMAQGASTSFEDHVDDTERVVEIYNAWGSSECSVKEGNPFPIKGPKKAFQEKVEGSIRKALMKNKRVGFVAGGLDDRGIYASCFDQGQAQYSPGLTAIFSSELTRDHLFQALFNRQCYATTGERILIGFFIAGAMMGSELSTKAKPGLAFNRHIHGFVAGTAPLKEVQIIRNGTVMHSYKPHGFHLDFTYDDSTPIAKASLQVSKEQPPFTFYYLRVIQENGQMAWSSPIWIDQTETINDKKPRRNNKKES